MTQDIYEEAQRLLAHARKPKAVADAERADIEAMKLARAVCKEVKEELDELIHLDPDGLDAHYAGEAIDIACKLYDAIMHPGE